MPSDSELKAAVAAERERCAKIADGWIEQYGHIEPAFVGSRCWACDAVRDVADAIRGLPGTCISTN